VTVLRNLILLLPAIAFLQGCGSILASLETGPIDEDPGKRTLAAQVRDESIETKAVVNLHAVDDGFDSADFTVVSFNGYVLVCGEVGSQALKAKAPDVLRDIEGVRRIYNELTVAPNSSAETKARDTWITTKIKSTLIAAPNVPALRVKVTTENSVVYLMGLLTPEEADRVARTASEVDGVERVVRLFELI